MSGDAEKKPKIIIDEDWKSQVEAERDELKKKQDSAATSDAPTQPEGGGTAQLPPVSFGLLVSSLATQTMAALGQMPDPVEGKAVVRLDYAKHHVDTLAMLQEKTKGNLTSEEEQMLEDVLHQLRMLYISVPSQPASSD